MSNMFDFTLISHSTSKIFSSDYVPMSLEKHINSHGSVGIHILHMISKERNVIYVKIGNFTLNSHCVQK